MNIMSLSRSLLNAFALILSGHLVVDAQTIEQVYMKSGSVIEGYISEQTPGKHIIVHSSKATIVVNSDSLQSKETRQVPLETMSAEWQKWAEANKNYVVDNGKGDSMLELATLKFKTKEFKDVCLIERGSLIKFIDLSPNLYTFVWGDMYRTVKHRRPDNLFSGIQETLILKDNSRVDGQIIEQFPGKDLKILTTKGEILSYKFSQVKQICSDRFNEEVDLWSQIQLLDVIHLKGKQKPLQGFISSRVLSKELVIDFEEGGQQTVPLSSVISYAKIPNTKYEALYDQHIAGGEILLDNHPAYFDTLKVHDQYLLIGDTVASQKRVGDTLCIETKLSNLDTPIIWVKAHKEMVVQQKGKKKTHIPYWVVTYQDFLQAGLPVTREITPLGNIRVTFIPKEKGDYVAFVQGKEGYIVVNVTE